MLLRVKGDLILVAPSLCSEVSPGHTVALALVQFRPSSHPWPHHCHPPTKTLGNTGPLFAPSQALMVLSRYVIKEMGLPPGWLFIAKPGAVMVGNGFCHLQGLVSWDTTIALPFSVVNRCPLLPVLPPLSVHMHCDSRPPVECLQERGH